MLSNHSALLTPVQAIAVTQAVKRTIKAQMGEPCIWDYQNSKSDRLDSGEQQ